MGAFSLVVYVNCLTTDHVSLSRQGTGRGRSIPIPVMNEYTDPCLLPVRCARAEKKMSRTKNDQQHSTILQHGSRSISSAEVTIVPGCGAVA